MSGLRRHGAVQPPVSVPSLSLRRIRVLRIRAVNSLCQSFRSDPRSIP
ncbi:hypothetical protein [Streptomyces sp. Da 82-17]